MDKSKFDSAMTQQIDLLDIVQKSLLEIVDRNLSAVKESISSNSAHVDTKINCIIRSNCTIGEIINTINNLKVNTESQIKNMQ